MSKGPWDIIGEHISRIVDLNAENERLKRALDQAISVDGNRGIERVGSVILWHETHVLAARVPDLAPHLLARSEERR